MRLLSKELINSPVTLNANWESEPIWIGHAVHFSVYLQFTGVPEGIFSLLYSNDLNEPNSAAQPTNFANIVGSEQSIDEAGTHGYSVQNAGYRWVKIKYNYVTSTGTLVSATFHSKGV